MAKTGDVLPARRNRVFLALFLALTALAGAPSSEAAPPSPPAPSRPAAPTPPAASGTSALQGIPGMDFSALSPAAQHELATVLSDEFCYCGCPHTLGQCLKGHPSCQHAKRMTRLATVTAAKTLTVRKNGAPRVS